MAENCTIQEETRIRGCWTKCANQGFWWHFPVESLWFRVLKMSLDIWVFESPWSNDPAGRKQMSLSKLKSHSYQWMPLCIDEQQLCQSSVSTWLVVLTRPQKTLKNLRFLSHFSNHFLSNFLLFHLSLSLSQLISTFMYQLILAKVHWSQWNYESFLFKNVPYLIHQWTWRVKNWRNSTAQPERQRCVIHVKLSYSILYSSLNLSIQSLSMDPFLRPVFCVDMLFGQDKSTEIKMLSNQYPLMLRDSIQTIPRLCLCVQNPTTNQNLSNFFSFDINLNLT